MGLPLLDEELLLELEDDELDDDEEELLEELLDSTELEEGVTTLCSYSVVLIFPTPAQVVTISLTSVTASVV